MSDYVYSRSVTAGVYDFPNPNRLDAAGAVIRPGKEVEAVLPGKAFAMRCDGLSVTFVFDYPLTSGEEALLAQTVMDHRTDSNVLSSLKIGKVAEIDGRTGELILLGFSYAGLKFSLSSTAQDKMMGTHQVRDDAALVYPIYWNTIDDAAVYEIVNSADLNGFYLTALGTIRAHLDSGTVLKNAVRAATTRAEIDAVVDSR